MTGLANVAFKNKVCTMHINVSPNALVKLFGRINIKGLLIWSALQKGIHTKRPTIQYWRLVWTWLNNLVTISFMFTHTTQCISGEFLISFILKIANWKFEKISKTTIAKSQSEAANILDVGNLFPKLSLWAH